MKLRAFSVFAAATWLACPTLTIALTATGLSSFEAIEEPILQYFPDANTFQLDGFVNIVDLGNGAFRMHNRYNAEWWDGDRDTSNRDRQRAEVKGLGPHQRHGETFEYATTWRLNPEFRSSRRFCHLFQLKSINGDSGAPLVTLSIHGEMATVEANPEGRKVVAREFPWKPDVWQTVRIRVKTSPEADGELLVSINGDEFQGKTSISLSRPGADAYRPKWGLYRRAGTGMSMGDDYAEHKDVSADNVAGRIDNAELETEARKRATDVKSMQPTLAWLAMQGPSAARDFVIGSIVALWAETDSTAAMKAAEKMKPLALRADAVGRVFSRWADRDVNQAMAWLRKRAPNRALDHVVWLFVTDATYRYVNRPLALEGAALISNPKLRADAFEHVTEIWSRQNPDAAIKYVQASPALNASHKAAIMERLTARRDRRKNEATESVP